MNMSRSILVLALMIAGTFLIAGAVSGDGYIVDDDWPKADYDKIQDAVDAAAATDQIFVYEGHYTENVVIDVAISIIGNGTDLTVIDGNESGYTLEFTTGSGGASVEDCLIINGSLNDSRSGVRIDDADGVTVLNCEITDSYTGIMINGCDNTVVEDVWVHNNSGRGIEIQNGDGHEVIDSRLVDNTYDGIYSYEANGCYFSRNNISFNYLGIMVHDGDDNNVRSNWIYNNSWYGVYFYSNTWHNNVRGNRIFNHSIKSGILGFTNCSYTDISNNSIYYNYYGIKLQSATGNNVTYNEIMNSTYFGVFLDHGADDNWIHHNNFVSNNDGSTQGRDNTGDNMWNTSDEGNYWSDYTGSDSNKDGVGDTPYSLIGGSGAQDEYPLMDDVDNDAPVKAPEFHLFFGAVICFAFVVIIRRKRD